MRRLFGDLIERFLQRSDFAFEKFDLVLRRSHVGSNAARLRLRRDGLVAKTQALVDQRGHAGVFKRELAFEIGDEAALGESFVGKLGAAALGVACFDARKVEFLTQFLVLADQYRVARFELVRACAQLVASGDALLELAPQFDVVGLLLLERPQRLGCGLDQLAEGDLVLVELADLHPGIEEQVAQGFVLFADLLGGGRAGGDILRLRVRRRGFLRRFGIFRLARRGCRLGWLAGPQTEYLRQLRHQKTPPLQRDSVVCHTNAANRRCPDIPLIRRPAFSLHRNDSIAAHR